MFASTNITREILNSFVAYSLKTHNFYKTSSFIASQLSSLGTSYISDMIYSVVENKKEFLSQNVEEILLDFDISILRNPSLKIESEDDLCNFDI